MRQITALKLDIILWSVLILCLWLFPQTFVDKIAITMLILMNILLMVQLIRKPKARQTLLDWDN